MIKLDKYRIIIIVNINTIYQYPSNNTIYTILMDQQVEWDDNAGIDAPEQPPRRQRFQRPAPAADTKFKEQITTNDTVVKDQTKSKDENVEIKPKQIERDGPQDDDNLWEDAKDQMPKQQTQKKKIMVAEQSNQTQETKEVGNSAENKNKNDENVNHDNLKKEPANQEDKKQPSDNVNTSNWDASMESNSDAFKKKKTEEQQDTGDQAQQSGFRRGDGGFKRTVEQPTPQQNQKQQPGFSGFGGRGRGSSDGNTGGFNSEGGRGGGFGDRGGGGFGGGRGGFGDRGFGDRGFGDRGFGDRGGRGGFGENRGFGDRNGGFGDRGGRGNREFGGFGDRGGRGGYGDRDGGGGGFNRGFQDRGGRGGGGRGGFGRRQFGDYNNGGGFGFRRQNTPQQPQKILPSNIMNEAEQQAKQVINVAQLSMIGNIPKPSEKSKISPQFRVNTTMASQPLGLKCWPTISIYIKRAKVSLFLSRIYDHNCSIIYFPYSNLSMNLYPGNMVNQFPYDYRKKLKQKNKPAGQAYLQKLVGVKNFQVIGFALINQQDLQTAAKSIGSLFDQAHLAEKQVFDSVLIPYSDPLGSLKPVLKIVFESLDKYENFKEVIITTNDPKTFCKASCQFLQIIQELADNNELVIQ